ncbi:hypothetical protein ACKZDW_08600 [Ralstonia syzygii subsp. celebesensis]
MMGLAEQRYRVSADFEHARLNAMERQYVIRREGRGVPSALHVQALQTELPRAEQGSPRHQWLTRQLREADGGVRQGGAAAASAGPSSSAQTLLNAYLEAANSAAAAARLRAGTAEDVGRQRQPLGAELKGWLKLAGAKSLPDAKAFDNEAYADAFARLLHRRRPWSLLPSLPAGIRLSSTGRRSSMPLRKTLTCARTCSPRRTPYWEAAATMWPKVDSHQLVEKVHSGEMDQPKLESWIRQRYRLDSLVTEVNRLVESSRNREGRDATMTDLQLAREPVETLLHAKVALKKELDLPKNIPSHMQYRRVSALKRAISGRWPKPCGRRKPILSTWPGTCSATTRGAPPCRRCTPLRSPSFRAVLPRKRTPSQRKCLPSPPMPRSWSSWKSGSLTQNGRRRLRKGPGRRGHAPAVACRTQRARARSGGRRAFVRLPVVV